MEMPNDIYDQSISDLNVKLKESCKMLCDKYTSLADTLHNSKMEINQYKTILTETLSYSVDTMETQQKSEFSSLSSTNCGSCATLRKELSTACQEKESLEYMKPYTQELVTKNEILKTRVRGLETEVSELNRQLTDTNRKRELYYSSIDRMETNITIMSKQLQNILDHLQLLNTKVKEAQVKNIELETVNRHQGCLLSDSYEIIKRLRTAADLTSSSTQQTNMH